MLKIVLQSKDTIKIAFLDLAGQKYLIDRKDIANCTNCAHNLVFEATIVRKLLLKPRKYLFFCLFPLQWIKDLWFLA